MRRLSCLLSFEQVSTSIRTSGKLPRADTVVLISVTPVPFRRARQLPPSLAFTPHLQQWASLTARSVIYGENLALAAIYVESYFMSRLHAEKRKATADSGWRRNVDLTVVKIHMTLLSLMNHE